MGCLLSGSIRLGGELRKVMEVVVRELEADVMIRPVAQSAARGPLGGGAAGSPFGKSF